MFFSISGIALLSIAINLMCLKDLSNISTCSCSIQMLLSSEEDMKRPTLPSYNRRKRVNVM